MLFNRQKGDKWMKGMSDTIRRNRHRLHGADRWSAQRKNLLGYPNGIRAKWTLLSGMSATGEEGTMDEGMKG